MNRVAGAVTSGQYLRGNGTNVVMSTIQASDVPTLNQNTTGTAAISSAVTITTSNTLSAFKVPFADTTASTTGDYSLLQDSTATFTYNPSTNTLVAGSFSGSLSGNASTATNLSSNRTNWVSAGTLSAVVGQLAWKEYGNNHTIFDASDSTAPNGSLVNNANAQIAWAGSFPTLMGWNGVNTYGVRVDSARVSDSTTGNAATATTANALNTANSYTVNSMTVTQANPYYFANRTSIGSGQVGIQLQTAGVSRWWMYLDTNNDNNLNFYNSINSINAVTFSNAGAITAANNVTAFSDERYKTNWRAVTPNFVEGLAAVKSGVYDRTDQEATQAGVSAQSLQELLPETVIEDESGRLSVAYGNAALVACVELAKEVLKLRAEIEALKQQ
jgi:hypothetical protein